MIFQSADGFVDVRGVSADGGLLYADLNVKMYDAQANDQALQGAQSEGTVGAATLADLSTAPYLGLADKTVVLVGNDPTAANNCYYRRNTAGPQPWIAMVDRVSAERVERIAALAGESAARKLMVEERAGRIYDTGSDLSRAGIDPLGNVAYGPRNDGRYQVHTLLVGAEFGTKSLELKADGYGCLRFVGPGFAVSDEVVIYDRDLTGTDFVNAARVTVDKAGWVSEAKMRDGNIVDTRSGAVITGAKFKSLTVLPDSVPSRSPAGFTCTGLSRITRGTYKGCFVVGDDGRLRDDDGGTSPYRPAWHIVSPDFRRILFTMLGDWNNSAQGVAVDTSGTDDTIWLGCSGLGQVRHYNTDGSEITADRITLSTLSITPNNANGVAYDLINHALWVTPSTGGAAYLIACDPAASPRLLRTISLPVVPDQLQYFPSERRLYYSFGANGTNGDIRSFHVDTLTGRTEFAALENVQAIEGFYIDRLNGVTFVVSDGGFHRAAKPSLNGALEFATPTSPTI